MSDLLGRGIDDQLGRGNRGASAVARQGSLLVSHDRWLHSETVDELRAQRSLKGLRSQPRAASVARPPLSRPAWLAEGWFPPIVAERPGLASGGERGRAAVLAPALAALVGLLVGVLAALAAFAARMPLPGQ